MTPRIQAAPPAATEEGRALEHRIQRNGRLLPLFRILMNSPAVADGLEYMLSTLRQQTSLPMPLYELIILRVAVLNRADYEFEAHLPMALRAGLSTEKVAAVRTEDLSAFDDVERLVLEYTDAMTRTVQVPDALYARVAAAFDAKACVELTATIAASNMVARLAAALDVH
jgi:AhpD family alkylhydroperoxidase